MTLLKAAPDPERATAAIAFTTGLEDPDTPLFEEEPKRVRDEMHAAWRTFFSALAAERPVVVVVEDIHWADPAHARPARRARRPGRGRRVLRVPLAARISPAPVRGGAVASATTPPSRSIPWASEMPTRWSARCWTSTASPTRCSARSCTRAEGNPFFLEEIVRQLVDNRSVRLEGGRWRAAGDITQVDDPRHGAGGPGRSHRPARPAGPPGAAGRGRRRTHLLAGRGPAAAGRRRRSRPRGAHHPRGARPRPLSSLFGLGERTRVHLQTRAHARCRLRHPPPARSVGGARLGRPVARGHPG